MYHLPTAITDLAFILVTAAIVTIIFKRFGQPVVLGYIVAGFLLGPHMPWVPTIKDTESVRIWAEIGVIILLFGLGLEFSLKRLASVGRSATTIAALEVLMMLGLGYFAGHFLGWKTMDSLFLGGILSISSTTIIVRALDELGLKNRRFATLAFGVLVVEDIFAILLMVLLSTIAATQQLAGLDLAVAGLRLALALVVWFALGIFLLAPLMNRIREMLNAETTLVVSVGFCLMMVLLASYLGFSPALGAFVMGSLFAGTRDGQGIERVIHPVRDLFAAVFFVSVGMLIEPKILIEHGLDILFIALLTVGGKFISTATGALISGTSLKHAVQTGLSLAQIGEFSFIIATLGMTLKVTSEFLYPIAVAVSVITTFATPYLIRSADPLAQLLQNRLPKTVLNGLDKYQRAVTFEYGRVELPYLLWKAYGWRTIINCTFVIAIFWIGRVLVDALSLPISASPNPTVIFIGVSCSLLSIPFLWAVAFGKPSVRLPIEDLDRLQDLDLGVSLVRGIAASTIAIFVLHPLVSLDTVPGVLLFASWVTIVGVGRFSETIYKHIEGRFLKSLRDKPRSQDRRMTDRPQLIPWDVGLVELVVHPNSEVAGISLQQARLRELSGITVAALERGHQRIVAPTAEMVLMPGDRLFALGSDEQIANAQTLIAQASTRIDPYAGDRTFGLVSLRLSKQSKYIGLSLRETDFRETVGGLLVGIERSEQRILNPDAATVLQADDLLWLVGDRSKVLGLRNV